MLQLVLQRCQFLNDALALSDLLLVIDTADCAVQVVNGTCLYVFHLISTGFRL